MSDNTKKIITRFAPSPTGYFHIGSARTALFNYLFAKHNGGKFLLRIEDTDKERSEDVHTQTILDSLEWLGISYDDELVIQSKNANRHREILTKMIADGFAYEGEMREDGTAKVIRFKNPNKKVTFTDLIRGDITFDTTELKDFVIAKSIDEPLYHLAVVVDDFDVGITHVIRGDDGISNTPRQILIQEAIGAPRPIYAHVPLLLAPDRSKLSKRKGAKSLTQFRDEGYLRDAFINYMVLLGWNPGTEKEIFTLDELIQEFDISKAQKGGAIFSEEKLRWFNAQHLRAKSDEEKMEILNSLNEFKELNKDTTCSKKIMLDIIFERVEVISDIEKLLQEGEFDYIFKDPVIDTEKILWKNNPDKKATSEIIKKVKELLQTVPENTFNIEKIKDTVWPLAEEIGKGEVLWPMRVALSGKEKSPDPFSLAELLGISVTLHRLDNAIEKLNES